MASASRKLVAARFLRALLDSGERAGVERSRALAEIGIDPTAAEDPAGFVPVSTMARAWEVVPALSADPCFGLHAGESTPLGVYGPLDLAAMSSTTVGEALSKVVRYYAVMGAMSELSLARSPRGGVVLTVETVVRAETDLRHYVEHLFALVVTRIRTAALALAAHDAAFAVRFVHGPPPASVGGAEHLRVLGSDVSFGARANELTTDASTIALPLVTANPELAPLLEREGKRLALRPDAPIAERVRAAIEQGLRDGGVDLADVAKRLGVGTRTLQRGLRKEGASFAEVLDVVRRDFALKTLEDGASGASDLAYTLGFSQPSAFFRAFKRWTGTTPASWLEGRRRR
ncbi:MAG: AraC family transcriptional regulator [Deltaproteobacteria bacterium]|nr:AraC family transcriptional regulator [Deltaproteobacteria bacterium]